MLRYPVGLNLCYANYDDLAKHILEIEKISNSEHIMWLNRRVSSKKLSPAERSKELEDFFSSGQNKTIGNICNAASFQKGITRIRV